MKQFQVLMSAALLSFVLLPRGAAATAECPVPPGGFTREDVSFPERNMSGVRLRANIGAIGPEHAAAVWWDLPAQAAEVFPGETVTVVSGTPRESGYVASINADIPGVGPFNQVTRYSVEKKPGNEYLITVDLLVEDVLARSGFGTYRFYKTGCGTVLETVNAYDPKLPLSALNDGAAFAAQQHQARYLSGREATAEELDVFRDAVHGRCH